MRYRLTAEDIEHIEKALNSSGYPKIEISVRNGILVCSKVIYKRL